MQYFFDVVIIGAGPAGMSCGISLQRQNVSNCVIDKKKFPRSKTCGGLITNKTLMSICELLDAESVDDLSNLFCDSTSCVSLFYKEERLTTTIVTKPLNFVDRTTFDFNLINYYKTKGGIVFDGEGNYELNLQEKTITLTNGDTVSFNKIVVADGANSTTRKQMNIKSPQLGFCIETYVSKEVFSNCHIGVYFGVVPKGYGWVFPAGEKICIGLGGVFSKKTNYTALLDGFLQKLDVCESTKYIGAFIPYGQVVNQNGRFDAVLIGDAAGFVDPIYGEGLYFAIVSGMQAAKAIIEKKNFCESFCKKMKPYVKIIKQGSILQKIFFSNMIQAVFKKIIKGKASFTCYYCDQQISEYNYSYMNLYRLYIDYKKRKN